MRWKDLNSGSLDDKFQKEKKKIPRFSGISLDWLLLALVFSAVVLVPVGGPRASSRGMAALPDPAPDEETSLESLATNVTAEIEGMIQRTTQLLAEYRQFSDAEQSHGHVVAPGLRALVQSATSEDVAFRQHLEELRSSSVTGQESADEYEKASARLKRLRAAVRCSNVPALETSWAIVKRCHRLLTLTFLFSLHPASGPCPKCSRPTSGKCPPKGQQPPSHLATVDAVVDGGAEWVRVLSLGERRLLIHMAEGGWQWDDDEASDAGSDRGDEIDASDISVAATVRHLVEAARANRHNYEPPRLHVVLTRVSEGTSSDLDRFIQLLRGLGRRGTGPAVEVVVDCANSDFLAAPPPPTAIAIQNLLPDELVSLTPTVNLDCTVLMSLVSDVTQARPPPEPWHRRDVVRQMAEEAEQGSSLVKRLYPALRGRRLVCTPAAARRFSEIVASIGSPAEVARLGVILASRGEEHVKERSSASLVAELQQLSENTVDLDLRLPVEVIEPRHSIDAIQDAIAAGDLPAVAGPVLATMTGLNKEIYMLGWIEGITTATTNNALAKAVVRLVEEYRTQDDEAGPKVWVYGALRALLTKGRPGTDAPTEHIRNLGAI